jgi:hypothetical protein
MKYYKAELDGKIIVRSSVRDYSHAVIFGDHWITSGYGSFSGSLENAQKMHKTYSQKWSDTYFTIVEAEEISESEFKTWKAKLSILGAMQETMRAK